MVKIYIVKYIINKQFYVQNLHSKKEVNFIKRKYDTSMGTCIFKKFQMLIP